MQSAALTFRLFISSHRGTCPLSNLHFTTFYALRSTHDTLNISLFAQQIQRCTHFFSSFYNPHVTLRTYTLDRAHHTQFALRTLTLNFFYRVEVTMYIVLRALRNLCCTLLLFTLLLPLRALHSALESQVLTLHVRV